MLAVKFILKMSFIKGIVITMNLLSEIECLSKSAKLDIGLAINYIERDEEFMFNADVLYHMASVVKIPIMFEAFRQIEIDKNLALDERLELRDHYKLSGTGILKFLNEGLLLTVEDLITLMIIISDNTATDILLDRIGGPLKVDKTMKLLGLRDIHVKMTIRQAHWDRGIRCEPLIDPREAKRYMNELQLIFDSESYKASIQGNSASPRAMNQLLCKIYNGEVLSKRSCDKMMDILYKQQLNTRIPLKLPRCTLVAHKDGTIPGVANDSGIIEISNKNHCAITVFTRDIEFMRSKDMNKALERLPIIESIIGDIALMAYNYGKTID
ncbi:MAG: serine hydrolase [Candidatus Bathyarchaeia archaeon]